MRKVYYDKEKNFTIVDVSGVKPIDLIKNEFGDVEYQEIELSENEDYIIVDGLLKKVTK